MRESLGIYGRVQDEGAEACDSLRVPGPAVSLELVNARVVLGDGRGELGRSRVISSALLCQLPQPVGLRGRVLLDGPGEGPARGVELLLKAAPAAKDLP